MAQKPKNRTLKKKEAVTTKERLISGCLYLSMFLPFGILIILLVLIWYRKSDFINSHSAMASIILVPALATAYTTLAIEKPAEFTAYYIPSTPIFIFITVILNITIFVSFLIALAGKPSLLDLLIIKANSLRK